MALNIEEIQRILPHRYPFLLVDRVVEIGPGPRIVAFKNLSVNEPFFQGHFPGRPVMPGVLIVEAMAQAAALLAYKTENFTVGDKLIYLMSLDNVKFRRPVVPGDRMMLDVEIVKHKGAIWRFRGEASVDGGKAAEAEFLAMGVDAGGAVEAAAAAQ